MRVAQIIHVKLSGEGDFGPVDLECAIPPARLPHVMAALFGTPVPSRTTLPAAPARPAKGATSVGGVAADGGQTAGQPSVAEMSEGSVKDLSGSMEPQNIADDIVSGRRERASLPAAAIVGGSGARQRDQADRQMSEAALEGRVPRGAEFDLHRDFGPSAGIDPAMMLSAFAGSFGDLVSRLQPPGYAGMIVIAAVWLNYRDGRAIFTRADIRRLIRRQEHLRQPRNFSRDFQTAVTRDLIAPVDEDGGFAVTSAGYQWFRDICIN